MYLKEIKQISLLTRKKKKKQQ
ncbi:MAG: hypothetical protein E3K40_12760 [Candidatus Brocadia sp.]|nr:hypothetical protein [Candidatus Brocadia sp.]MDG6027554.1 hypothetical protein [Candidatus Brocadia sp.]